MKTKTVCTLLFHDGLHWLHKNWAQNNKLSRFNINPLASFLWAKFLSTLFFSTMLFVTAIALWYVYPPLTSGGFRVWTDVIRGIPIGLGLVALWVFGIYFYHNAIRDRIYKYSDSFFNDVMRVLECYTKPYGVSERDIPILMKIQGGVLGVDRVMNVVWANMINMAIHIIENETDSNIHYEKRDLNRLLVACERIGLFLSSTIAEIYSEAKKTIDEEKQKRELAKTQAAASSLGKTKPPKK